MTVCSIVYISQAKSGRKGYYCMVCKGEMQAVKSEIDKRKSTKLIV